MIWLALVTLYLVWGSTYLAIRVAIDTLPPLLMASVRFLIAGAILYAVSIRRGDWQHDRPGIRQWRAAIIIGAALLLGGNGGVVWAERTVASGIVALLVATVPLLMALIDRIALGRRLSRPAVIGLAVGFLGLVLLISPSGSGRFDAVGTAVALLAALSWAAGSLYSRRAPLPARPLVGTGMEMLAGGVLLGILGIAIGEAGRIQWALISLDSLLALAYLIVFGALVGFSAYLWLLRVAPTSLVSTYAFVNPVVAVLLGWVIRGEPLTLRTVLAGGVIVAAVALIVTARPARQSAPGTAA